VLGAEDEPATASDDRRGITGDHARQGRDRPAVRLPSAEAVALIGADLVEEPRGGRADPTAAEPILAKGLYSISDVACSLSQLRLDRAGRRMGSAMERDGSTLPQQASTSSMRSRPS
jgi:hypothetical protein